MLACKDSLPRGQARQDFCVLSDVAVLLMENHPGRRILISTQAQDQESTILAGKHRSLSARQDSPNRAGLQNISGHENVITVFIIPFCGRMVALLPAAAIIISLWMGSSTTE